MLSRDWKILELMTDGEKAVDGIGPIKSVRRLSDNKIFSIGDKTLDGPISSFFIVGGDMFVQVGYVKMYGYDGVYKCSHLPLRFLE